MALIKATHHITIKAPIEKIWDLLINVNQWPERFGHVQSANMNGQFVEGNSFQWKSGGVKIVSTIEKADEYKEIFWTGKAIGVRAEHRWVFTEKEGVVLLETEETMEGWLISLMKGMMKKKLDETLVSWLEDVKRVCEG